MRLLRRQTYLVTILLIFLFLVIPVSGLQNSQKIQSRGTISNPTGLLYGVCSHPWALTERDCQKMKTLGTKYIKMDFIWKQFEPYRDAPFVFSQYDKFVEWAKANNLEIVALLMYVPTWIRSDRTIPTGADFDDFVTQFGQFVYAVVDHYKGSITYFEIWNEANGQYFWRDPEATIEGVSKYNRGVAVTKYVTLLKEAYTRAKAANPNCKIISSGLATNDYVYVQEMYDNGVKGYFDYLGLHPYFYHSPTKNYDPDYVDWDSPQTDPHIYRQFPKIKLVRDIMVANRDKSKDIFITELGVGRKDGPEGPTTEEMQADRLRRVFEKIDHDPGYPFVNAVMWYQFRDKATSSSYMYGLLREDYTPRHMYYTYKDVIASYEKQ